MKIDNKKMKVAILGIYPPPYGGVSVHCQRLAERLSSKKDIEITFYDMIPSSMSNNNAWYRPIFNRVWWSLKILFGTKTHDLIHYHGINPYSFTLFILAIINLVRIPVTVTFHSLRYEKKRPQKWVARMVLGSFQAIICVNEEIRINLLELGIQDARLHVISPYIPPKNVGNMVVSSEAKTFLETHSPTLIANVTKLVFHNGVDLYGTDMYIELATFLKRLYPNFGFLIMISMINDKTYFNSLINRIKLLELESNVMLFTNQVELYPLISKANVLVRATNSDSYGISVAEAIELGVPAIASDVTDRPKGSILFKNRDQDALNSAVLAVLQKAKSEKPQPLKKVSTVPMNVPETIKVYKKILCPFD